MSKRTNTNQSSSENNIIKLHSADSHSAYIEMHSPLQLTLEYCRGTDESDFINILMLSPGQNFYSKIDTGSSLNKFNLREPHRHNFFEIMIILKGEIYQQIEGTDYQYSTGTCCVINRNIHHREKFYGEALVLFIGLSSEFITQLIHEQSSFYFHNEMWKGNSIFNFLKKNIDSEKSKDYLDIFPSFQNQNSIFQLHRISDRLLHLMMHPVLGSTYGIKSMICELFSYLDNKEAFHITPVSIKTSADLLLFSKVSHLFEDTDGRLSRAELSSLLNYSGNYINTVVKRYAGMCLYDYGLTFRLKKASELLRSSDASISSISASLNFNNRTHFYDLFKEKYGVTPGEYRRT
ncbi:MAG TPA: helix-turn-helix domain-containing protein [Candidatus Merdenecus merdavium]|nr:helix-turn-helix domain-containing protein [Candidatus Merdenecus merdavium]